jgi:hypothetical protein
MGQIDNIATLHILPFIPQHFTVATHYSSSDVQKVAQSGCHPTVLEHSLHHVS